MIHQIEMNIDVPPVSMNNKLVPVRGRMVPNSALKKPIEDINTIVNFKYRRHLDEMFSHFCPKTMFYSLDLYILVPRTKFFTKAGKMSENIIDGDNCVKVLKDAIWPKALKLNDAFAKKDMVFVLPWDGYDIVQRVTIKIEKWEDWL